MRAVIHGKFKILSDLPIVRRKENMGQGYVFTMPKNTMGKGIGNFEIMANLPFLRREEELHC
jgi:hypothetical protein